MDRRKFIRNSASFLFGSILGVNNVAKAFASYEYFAKPRISLIIDDIGPNLHRTRQFLQLNIPLTFAILPHYAHSEELAFEIHDAGHDILLHQPMEPYSAEADPGPGALYVGDEAAKIFHVIEKNLSTVPFAIGLNNHMGSRFTTYRKEIRETLMIIKQRGLFFVDSVTSHDSKGYHVAKQLQMPAARRHVFLDNNRNELAILFQLKKLIEHARQFGHAIGIGHPFSETARAIKLFLNFLINSNITVVPVSEGIFSA